MDDARQAQLLIERWVQQNLVPQIVIFLSTSEYTPDCKITGLYGNVSLHRTVSGQVHVRYSNGRMAEALTELLGDKHLVQHSQRASRRFVTHVMPKA